MNGINTPKKSDSFIFFVNGKKVEDHGLDPEFTLIQYLREKLHLPGTKLGCSEGGCGACTVMVSKLGEKDGSKIIRHYTVNACLTPVVSMYGLAVTTVEGIGSTKTKLHPVQERLAKAHGSQCGFCTPGFVMSMYTLLRNCPTPTMTEIEDNLAGNLCRCTGYRPILEGFRTFSSESNFQSNGCGKKDCCQLQNGVKTSVNGTMECTPVLFDPNLFDAYEPSQDIIFPPELLMRNDLRNTSLHFKGPRVEHFRPADLKELVSLKAIYPNAKIIVGNTEVGVEVKYKNQEYEVTINPSEVKELYQCKINQNNIEIGASVTLSEVENFIKEIKIERKEFETRHLSAMEQILHWFGGRQIRNSACIGGNIMTASPISDLNPIFMALGATLKLFSGDSVRDVSMNENFFTGYRKTIVKGDEVLVSVKLPFTTENQYFFAHKQSRRREDDISIVNGAFNIEFEPESLVVVDACISFGGMAPVTILAKKTMKLLKGKKWNQETLESATSCILQEMNLNPSAPGGMVEYRSALTASFLLKTYLNIRNILQNKYPSLGIDELNYDEQAAIQEFHPRPTSSLQVFQEALPDDVKIDPVGQPEIHVSGKRQVTGEAIYVDDMPTFSQELHGWLVKSTKAKAKIVSIDAAKALQMDEVVAFFSAKDLPGDRNKMGVYSGDEEIFALDEVSCVGQVIGIIIAKCPRVAELAAKTVEIVYEELGKPIITIQDAIKAQSFYPPYQMNTGNVDDVFNMPGVHTMEGESYIGGQEHFYLEPNAHIAVPHEEDEMEIFSCTQNPEGTQARVANACAIPRNRVVIRVKRIGGGFGGKEMRPAIMVVPIAVAAYNLRRPVRITVDRQDDMVLTGGRNPFRAKWKVGFDSNGKFLALESNLYLNAGNSMDLSGAVMMFSMFCLDNAYKIENMKLTGYCCKTNLPSNTAFRGFGGPQGIYIIEDIIGRIGEYLNIDAKIIREKNFYNSKGDSTHYGEVLENCNFKRCWDLVLEESMYEKRKKTVSEFNKNNSYQKRGICAIPLKSPISFRPVFLNQAAALVMVYTDGSILLSHGGTEMGQGLYTKMIQVASKALSVPMDRIYTMETSTDKVPNTSSTAASVSADMNGMAILNACEKIVKNLEPYKKKNPDGGWDKWVTMAYLDRVSLSANGFYKTPGLIQPKNMHTLQGSRQFNYFSYGAAVSEVQIDCLTGNYEILQSDIVFDVGKSLNPAIDIGQIEGAFLQGVGLLTLEELQYSPGGEMLTKGPGAYKIPGILNIPRSFNVTLLKDSLNKHAVYSSKAVGEPPLLLATSVFQAIRCAVVDARKGRTDDKTAHFQFDAPATCEKIRMACKDNITEQIKSAEPGTFKPWAVSP